MHQEGTELARYWLRLATAVAALLASACFSSCSGSSGPDGPGIPGSDPDASQPTGLPLDISADALPAFPPVGDPSPFRRVSDTTVDIDGSGFGLQAGENNYSPDPTKYVLIPGGEDDLAWAQYNWMGGEVERPADLTINVQSAPLLPGGEDDLPLSYWIGLSNYSQGSWEWSGPYNASHTLTLNSQQINDRYTSVLGHFSYVVLAWGGDSAAAAGHIASRKSASADPQVGVMVTTCRFNTRTSGGPNWFLTRPPMTPITSVAVDKSQPSITIFWNHLGSGETPDINAATQYEVSRFEPGVPGLETLGIIDAPGGAFRDPQDNQGGVPGPQVGKVYRYILCPINAAGLCRVSLSPRVGIDGAPVAVLQLLPGGGFAPVNCNLTAEGSFDPDGGSILNYEWDLDNDGVYEFSDPSSELQHLFLDPGSYLIHLRVTDDENDTCVDTRTLIVRGWAHSFGQDLADDIGGAALDSSGNAYYGGSFATATDDDALLLKYDELGSLQFAKRFGSAASDEFISRVQVASNGTIFVAGSVSTANGEQLIVGSLDASGQQLWSTMVGDSFGTQYATGMRLDSSEQFVYVCGNSDLQGQGGSEIVLLKIDVATGDVVWQRTWGTPGGEFARGLAVAGDDEIYICGSNSNAGNTDAVLLRYNSQGQEVWARQWGGAGFDQYEEADVDSTGRIVCVGYSDSFDSNGDIIVISYGPLGGLQMQRGFGGTQHESVTDMVVDGQDRILLTCSASGYSGLNDSLFVALNPLGNPIVQRRLEMLSSDVTLTSIACVPGIVALGGQTQGLAGNWMPFDGQSFAATASAQSAPGVDAAGSGPVFHPGATVSDLTVFEEDNPSPSAEEAFCLYEPFE